MRDNRWDLIGEQTQTIAEQESQACDTSNAPLHPETFKLST
jgi:hypothetical protein